MAFGGPVREIVTDVLEIAGLLLLVAAGAVASWQVRPYLGFVAAGLGCVLASVVLVVSTKAPKR